MKWTWRRRHDARRDEQNQISVEEAMAAAHWPAGVFRTF